MGNKLSFGDTFSIVFAVSLALGLVTCILGPIFMMARSDGKVNFCYVTTDSYQVPSQPMVVVYNVWGNREWRSDMLFARNLTSLDSAQAAAKQYGCLLK